MKEFTNINPDDLPENVFKMIGKDWMLVSAGKPEKCNMMTASWGGLGVLWNKRVAFVFIRPQRYTDSFIRESDVFNICFLDESYRDILNFCGTYSGRDTDKVAETGLTPKAGKNGAVWFEESRLVMECRKLYAGEIDPAFFIDKELVDINYPGKDFHHLYIVEIVNCFKAVH